MKVLAIIPAKLDSKRLKKKNICDLNGKPMFLHSVDYAKESKYDVDVVVSSESDVVKNICDQNGVRFFKRPMGLCSDVEVVDVYEYVVNHQLHFSETYDLVVGLQPDNPNRSNSLDACIDYMIENSYDDLITVNPSYKRSGSVRIFKYDYLKSGKVSKRLGCIKDGATDILYESDLESIKHN